MGKKQNKKTVFRSMREFEKELMPKSLAKKLAENPRDAEALGIRLAKESLGRVRQQLSV